MKTTIKIIQTDDETIIENENGRQWHFDSMVMPSFALSAIIYGTLVPWYDQAYERHDQFEITLTINPK